MNNRNIAKILVLVLSLALIIGAAVGISAAAESETNTGSIDALSIVHGEKIQILVAVTANAEDNVSVSYAWAGEDAKAAVITDEVTKEGCKVFVTEGVAAYDLAKVATITTYVDGEAVDTKTYSVAEFLYSMLYRDGFATSDDEQEAAAADCYEALLAYGAASQIHLGENADKLVTDATYVYTTVEGATVDGTHRGVYAAPGEFLDITPEYTNAKKWILVNVDGTKSQFTSTTSVSGVACAQPVVATASVDFESDVTEGVSLNTFTGSGTKVAIPQTSITADSASDYYYGVLGKLVADPVVAGNQVLSIVVNNGVNNTQTSNGGNLSTLKFAPSATTEGGKIHVFEFDINLQHANKAVDDPFFLTAYAADGTEIMDVMPNGNYDSLIRFDKVTSDADTMSNAYHIGNEYAQSSEGTSTSLLNAQEWYRVRITWDQANAKLYYDVSVDGGNTWYILTVDKTANANSSEVASIGFEFACYGCGYSVLLDDVNYTVVDELPTRVAEVFVDAIEATARLH